MKQLSKEYKALRKRSDQECCSDFGSGLMKIMEVLGDSIALNTNEKRIIQLMGLPDTVASKEHPLEYHFTMLENDVKILIYYWRGMHDFLYFTLVNDKLIAKQWYYARE